MRAKHGNWNSGEITSAEMLLMFQFPCVDQGSRARQYQSVVLMHFGELFLLQAESSRCSSTFLLLHAYSCFPLDGLSSHHGCLGECGRRSTVDNWLHTQIQSNQSFQPHLPLLCKGWGVDWKSCSPCAQGCSCWISSSQLLMPLSTISFARRGDSHSILRNYTLNTC